jgi:thiol-disulfide isomerase/thioredoxin
MKRYTILFSIIAISLISNISVSFGQVRALNVGDTVPDIFFKNFLNGPKNSASLSDYKDKVIIIDFWSTTCAPCIKGLPILDSLQKKHPSDLVILPVTYEKRAVADELLHRKKLDHMPSVVEETDLNEWFPHLSIPHEVIINKKGIVVGITGGGISDRYITEVIAGKMPFINLKKDLLDFIKGTTHLTEERIMPKENILYHTMVTGGVPSLNTFFTYILHNKEKIGLQFVNHSILNLYLTVLNKPSYYRNSRVIYEGVKDSLIYTFKKNATIAEQFEWALGNSYCYEIIAQGLSIAKMYEIMKAEITKTFGNKFGTEFLVEKRNIPCLILKRISSGKPTFATASYEESKEVSILTEEIVSIVNKPMSFFKDRLEMMTRTAIVDETYYPGNIDFIISNSVSQEAWKNNQPLRQLLQANGLDLIPGIREVEVVVIKERKF